MDISNRRRLPLLAPLAVAAALALSSCSGGGHAPEALPPVNAGTNTETVVDPATNAETPPAPAGYTAPLTGMAAEAPAAQRPVAVMINNFGKARPQSGLPHADVVWEVLAEGGITRLIAVFQSDAAFTDPVGPIRSIRPYLIELAESYHSVIVHAGASNDAYAILQRQHKEHLDEITNAGSYFYRDKSRKAPHNLYSTLDKLRAGAEKKGYAADVPAPSFTFMNPPVAPADGAEAASVELTFQLDNYMVSYAYDAAKQLYLRSINGKPHTDLTSGSQLSATNLVVLGAGHTVLDDVGRLEVDLQSGGPAKVIRLGKAVDAEWRRDADGMIRVERNGAEVPFAPGKTYYHIVPMKPSFDGHVTIH